MTKRSLAALLVLLLAISACKDPSADRDSQASLVADIEDPHSFANFNEVRVEHMDLDLTVDFERRALTGSVTLTLGESDAERLVLDTRDLDIRRVVVDSGREVSFSLGDERPLLGRALEIAIPSNTSKITVDYVTSPGAEALQWLAPEQTAGGVHPFLFSQSQAILARTWVPCQDSPAVRTTYSATVRVPAGLLALMSAENSPELAPDGVYRFEMRQPIPSYLLALAVGDLRFLPLGERSGVYAEPSVVEAAAWEFADTERMIGVAESLYGPYPWERYDLLVLPPSFPFGGMENPRLTFATPTILAGDRSLVALVAHELAHSWSGNLVTNATWKDFWLNEGFTSYIENRLMEELYGREYSQMLAVLDVGTLRRALDELEPQSPDSHLVLDLAGRSPDDGMTEVAYNKGANFLRALENLVGRERWDAFLADYFGTFAFTSIDTPTFIGFLEQNLLADDPQLAQQARVSEWIYQPGLPANLVEFEPAAFAEVGEILASWRSGTPAGELTTDGWTTHHWLHFLRSLPEDLSTTGMAELDGAFAFTASGNAEVLAAWLEIAVRRGYEPSRPALEAFLTSVGRLKFLYPLYAGLAESDEYRDWAHEIYGRARPGYHPVTIGALDRVLDWPPQATPGATGTGL